MSSFQFTQNGPFLVLEYLKINSKRDWNHIVHNVYDTQTCHIFATNALIFVKNSDFTDFKKSTFLVVFWVFFHDTFDHNKWPSSKEGMKGTRQKILWTPPHCQKWKLFKKKSWKNIKKHKIAYNAFWTQLIFFKPPSPKFGR